MYGADLAEVFELIHRSRGKSYLDEAQKVAEQVRSRKPDAVSLLDVACGTGSHLKAFVTLFDHVEGLEISEPFLRAAKAAVPQAELHLGDMREFDLGRTFDAISCMFGSIGYMADTDELSAALTRFARHLVQGGVLAVDPWWFLENYTDGYVSGSMTEVEGMTISRVSHSRLEGTASRMDVHYVVADSGSGTRHFVENHLITLFTRRQYENAFTAAGFTVDYIEGLHAGRGLFVGVRN